MTQPVENSGSNLNAAPKRRGRRIVLRVFLALLIFAAGAVSGAGLTVIVTVHRFQQAMHHPETIPPRLAAEMKRRLKLTDMQTAQVQEILVRRQERLQKLRQQIAPEVTAQFSETHEEIAKILTPEQQEKWDAWFTVLKKRWLPGIAMTQPAESVATRPEK